MNYRIAVVFAALLVGTPASVSADPYAKAVAVYKVGDAAALKKAREHLIDALKADKTHVKAATLLAETDFQLWEIYGGWNKQGSKDKQLLGIIAEAEKAADMAIAAAPDRPEGYDVKAVAMSYGGLTNGVLDTLNRVNDLLKVLDKCMALDPEGKIVKDRCYRAAGAVHVRLPGAAVGLGKADKYLTRALEIDPKNVTTHNFYAEYLAARKKTSEAIAALEKNIERIRAKNPPGYYDKRELAKAEGLLAKLKAPPAE